MGLSVHEKKFKTDFQYGNFHDCGSHKLLAIFDLQVTSMIPTNFEVNWPFGSGEEAKNRFSRLPPSWISDRKDFSYF